MAEKRETFAQRHASGTSKRNRITTVRRHKDTLHTHTHKRGLCMVTAGLVKKRRWPLLPPSPPRPKPYDYTKVTLSLRSMKLHHFFLKISSQTTDSPFSNRWGLLVRAANEVEHHLSASIRVFLCVYVGRQREAWLHRGVLCTS